MTNATEDIVVPQTEFDPETSNFIEVPVGIHNALIIGAEPAPPYAGDPEAKPQIKFIFQLTDLVNRDGTKPEKWAWCNQSFNPRSKLWGWYEQVTGLTPAAGEPFRTSSMIDKPCRLFFNKVKQNTAAGPKEIVKIVDVLGPEAAPAVPAAAQRAPLAERLKAEAAPAEELKIDYCSVEGCEAEAGYYTPKGTPFCNDHP